MWCFTIQRTSKNFASELRRNVMASNGIAIIGRVPCRSTGYEVKGEILDYGDVIESCRLPGRELCYHSQLKGVYMSEPTVTHLERRKIEAGVLIPMVQAFQLAIGKERADEIAQEVASCIEYFDAR